MSCVKNTHIKLIFIVLILLTLAAIIFFYYYGLYHVKKNAPKLIYNANFTLVKNKTRLKYIVYECRGWCGGWGDRLKGNIFNIIKLVNNVYEILFQDNFCFT